MSDADELIDAAQVVRAHAYAPYSHYHVGAALRANGKIYVGANVENASYGLALCAERAAVAAAVIDGSLLFEALAVVTSSAPPAAPCGMCRQVLAEFVRALPIVLVNDAGARVQTSLEELLPRAFHGEDIP